jgi:hypothetical protein
MGGKFEYPELPFEIQEKDASLESPLPEQKLFLSSGQSHTAEIQAVVNDTLNSK